MGKKSTPTLDDMVRETHQRLGVGAKKKPRDNPEQRLQSALVDAAWNGSLGIKYPELRDLYANANWAGVTGPKQGAARKAEGVKAGVPDLTLPYPMMGANTHPDHPYDSNAPYFHALYLETKVPGSKPRPEQTEFMKRLVARGYAIAVYRTLEEGLDLLVRYVDGRWVQHEGLLK
jgi:hypothetical protein